MTRDVALHGSSRELLRTRRLPAHRGYSAPRRVVVIGTGSELALAQQVAGLLEQQGIGADVVSMPCCELFDEQDAITAPIFSRPTRC